LRPVALKAPETVFKASTVIVPALEIGLMIVAP
jgi:hypothetical protein